jgi:hypothetical protein
MKLRSADGFPPTNPNPASAPTTESSNTPLAWAMTGDPRLPKSNASAPATSGSGSFTRVSASTYTGPSPRFSNRIREMSPRSIGVFWLPR